MSQIIGFASQFYTLWDYQPETHYAMLPSGKYIETGINHKYYYIKNISTDLDKVKEFYPSVTIDEGLRGQYRSFEKHEKLDLPEGMISFGKYVYRYASDIAKTDFSYILWIIENSYDVKLVAYCKELPEVSLHMRNEIAAVEAKIAAIKRIADGTNMVTFCNNPNRILSDWYDISDSINPELIPYANCYHSQIDTEDEGYTAIAVFGSIKSVDGRYPYNMAVIGGKAMKVKGKSVKVELTPVYSHISPEGRILDVFLSA